MASNTELKLEITASIEQVARQMEVLKNKILEIPATVKPQIEALGTAVSSVGSNLAAFGAVIGSAKALQRSIIDIVSQTEDWVLSQAKIKKALGSTYTETAGLSLALKEYGVSGSAVQQMILRLNMQMRQSEEAFRANGIQIRDTNGNFRPMIDIIFNVTDRINSMKEGADRNQLSLLAFGRAASNLYPLLKLNREGLAEATEKARQFGLIVDDEAVKSTNKMKQSTGELNLLLTALKVKIGMELQEPFINFVKSVRDGSVVSINLLVSSIKILIPILSNLGVQLGLLAAIIFSRVIPALTSLYAVILANPITAAFVATITAAGAAFSYFSTSADRAAESYRKLASQKADFLSEIIQKQETLNTLEKLATGPDTKKTQAAQREIEIIKNTLLATNAEFKKFFDSNKTMPLSSIIQRYIDSEKETLQKESISLLEKQRELSEKLAKTPAMVADRISGRGDQTFKINVEKTQIEEQLRKVALEIQSNKIKLDAFTLEPSENVTTKKDLAEQKKAAIEAVKYQADMFKSTALLYKDDFDERDKYLKLAQKALAEATFNGKSLQSDLAANVKAIDIEIMKSAAERTEYERNLAIKNVEDQKNIKLDELKIADEINEQLLKYGMITQEQLSAQSIENSNTRISILEEYYKKSKELAEGHGKEIQAIEKKYAKASGKINLELAEQIMSNKRKQAEDLASFFSPIVSAWNEAVSGMLSGTISLRQGMQKIWLGIGRMVDKVIMDMMNNWLQEELRAFAQWSMIKLKQVIFGTTVENQMQAAKTAAAIMGLSVATGATEAEIALALKKAGVIIPTEAATAEAKSISWFAGMNPFVALALGAVIGAAVMSLLGNIGSAAGGWDYVPVDGQMAELHKGEMVLPANLADRVRNMTEGSSPKSTNVTYNINAMDSKSFTQFAKNNKKSIYTAYSKSLRSGVQFV